MFPTHVIEPHMKLFIPYFNKSNTVTWIVKSIACIYVAKVLYYFIEFLFY